MTVLRRSQLTLRPAFRRPYGTTAHHKSTKVTIGIRREDPLRIWERRCPLTPDAVHELVHKDGVEVLVQPCERRVFTANDFIRVRLGSTICPTLFPRSDFLSRFPRSDLCGVYCVYS